MSMGTSRSTVRRRARLRRRATHAAARGTSHRTARRTKTSASAARSHASYAETPATRLTRCVHDSGRVYHTSHMAYLPTTPCSAPTSRAVFPPTRPWEAGRRTSRPSSRCTRLSTDHRTTSPTPTRTRSISNQVVCVIHVNNAVWLVYSVCEWVAEDDARLVLLLLL